MHKRIITCKFIKNALDLGRAHFLLWFLFIVPAYADNLEQTIQKAKELKLAEAPMWKDLIYVSEGGQHSAVISDNFFLSLKGKYDPKEELIATITAFYNAGNKQFKNDARCRFPARYAWLSKYLTLPYRNLRDETCISKEHWKAFDSINSISLLLVSGYWGNPASSFGHALMRLNTKSATDPYDLFDLTLNYGAKLPAHESTIKYILKGLFGGYQGLFSDQYFYTQDLTYGKTEFRDIWDFELNLTDEERQLLIFHIWEITGEKFRYYFINKNCAFRLAGLTDMVVKEKILNTKWPWYLPESLFFRLKEIDKERLQATGKGLIRSINFIPSSKRTLFYEISRLNKQEQAVFNSIVIDGFNSMPAHLESLERDSQINVLNCLLSYQKYRLIAEKKTNDEEMQKLKDRILLIRLGMPIRKDFQLKVPQLPSYVDGSPPMTMSVGMGMVRKKEPYLRLSWSPFKKETVGLNSYEGDEFAVADLNVGLFEREQEIFVDQFDLIRIMNLETMPIDVIKEGKLSWEARMGMDRIEKNKEDYYDGVFSVGLGKAYRLNENMLIYGMVDLAGHTIVPNGRLRPHVGLRLARGSIKSWVYVGGQTTDYHGHMHEVWGGKIQYTLNQKSSLNAQLSNEKSTLMSLGYSWYW